MDLAFTELGSGSPVLILHGLFGCKRNWASIAKNLSESHRIFTLDMRNHGESPHSSKMTYFDMATDVTHFIKSHELGPSSIIGHSMGGKTAMLIALTRPELVDRLLVLDIAPVRYDHNYSNYINTMKNIDLSQISSRIEAELLVSHVIKNQETRKFLMQNLVSNDHNSYKWRVNIDAFKAHMIEIMGFPKINNNKAYIKKTLFLGGRKSDYITAQYQCEISRLFPYSEVDFIEDAGHWIHSDQPKAVLESFQVFLR